MCHLEVSPPRERPRAWSQSPLFGPSPLGREHARSNCRSSDIRYLGHGEQGEEAFPYGCECPTGEALVHGLVLAVALRTSDQRAPEPKTHKTPFTNNRLSEAARPGSDRFPGSIGSIRCHCASLNSYRLIPMMAPPFAESPECRYSLAPHAASAGPPHLCRSGHANVRSWAWHPPWPTTEMGRTPTPPRMSASTIPAAKS
jgi:hypothetical protein